MKTKIQKWGNSFGVRLPMDIINDNKIMAGTPVKISEKNNKIIIEYFPNKRKTNLNEMLDNINDKNLHSENNWGEPQGKEVW